MRLNWTYSLPIGRGRRFGTDMNKVARHLRRRLGTVGHQPHADAELLRADGIRLVGMTKDELQKEFKIRITSNPTTGATIVLNAPDDIILNTRRAFSTDPTSATGYSALGVPEGRYIARASREGCIALYPGDCDTPDQIVINGPWFVRFDIRATKRVPIKGRLTAEFSIEVMNLFDNINFNPSFNPGGGTGIFQVTSAFRDTGVDVNDPGGRLGQIVWRVSW